MGLRLLQCEASARGFAAPEPKRGASLGSSAGSVSLCETTAQAASSARLRRGAVRPQARVERCTWPNESRYMQVVNWTLVIKLGA